MGDDAISTELDEPTAMAAAGAISKACRYAHRASRWNSELLPNEGADGRSGGGERQYQVTASPGPRIQEPEVPPAEGTTHGGDQNRICRCSESGLKCALYQILAQSRYFHGSPSEAVW